MIRIPFNFTHRNLNIAGRAALVLSLSLTIFLAKSFAQQASSDQATVWNGVYTEDQAKRGASTYTKECSKCHGQSLSEGEEAPPLAGGAFLANWGGLTVGDLFDRMRSSMPQDDPGKLSSQQYADIIAFILKSNDFPAGKTEVGTHSEMLKQILIEPNKPESASASSKGAAENSSAPKPTPESKSSAPGGNAGNGKELYVSVGCVGCHGPTAKGSATKGPQITPPPLPLAQFLKFVRQPTGGMIAFPPDQVSDSQLTDIYAFLQSLSEPLKK